MKLTAMTEYIIQGVIQVKVGVVVTSGFVGSGLSNFVQCYFTNVKLMIICYVCPIVLSRKKVSVPFKKTFNTSYLDIF